MLERHELRKVHVSFLGEDDGGNTVSLPDNPIEYLGRATKRQATHNHYFPLFTDLVHTVRKALSSLAAQPDYVRSLFTLYLQQLPQPLRPIGHATA
jgi:hypothetical protein